MALVIFSIWLIFSADTLRALFMRRMRAKFPAGFPPAMPDADRPGGAPCSAGGSKTPNPPRLSFYLAMRQLWGPRPCLNQADTQLGRGEQSKTRPGDGAGFATCDVAHRPHDNLLAYAKPRTCRS
ncbi:MAG: hypothetical protein CM15mP21_5490 [Hyphomicrobiales bacterium]|nr:MAG: hypothetical protein CM15mP21_5490 [Hyphomicrobiales bacterium]